MLCFFCHTWSLEEYRGRRGKGRVRLGSGRAAYDQNVLNAHMNAYNETNTLYNQCMLKLVNYTVTDGPGVATRADFSGQPKGFRGSQQSPWLPTCLQSGHSFCFWHPHATLLWLAFPSLFMLHGLHFRSGNRTELFPLPT